MSFLLDLLQVFLYILMAVSLLMLILLLGVVLHGRFDTNQQVARELRTIRERGAILDSQGVLFTGRDAPDVGVPVSSGHHDRNSLGNDVASDYRGEAD